MLLLIFFIALKNMTYSDDDDDICFSSMTDIS